MTIVIVRDAIHANVHSLPPGHAAGYTTGSADIRWTGADWHSHPAALRICQDAGATDATADYLDVERHAATNADAPHWVKRAKTSYEKAARPGQRRPAIYTSAANVTPLADALKAGGVNGGVGLVVANWNLSQEEAAALVRDASGPFPIVGVQFASLATFDMNVFSAAWMNEVSGPHAINPVKDLKATARYTQADVSWQAASRTCDYLVKAWVGDTREVAAEKRTGDTKVTLHDLHRGTRYRISVWAQPGTGEPASAYVTTKA